MVTVMDTTSGTPAGHYMTPPWDLVGLGPLMASGLGCAEVRVGLIDGPVAVDHPDLAAEMIRALPGRRASCALRGAACFHGTFVAGILSARRGSDAPALCPGCTLLVRPIFSEAPALDRAARRQPAGSRWRRPGVHRRRRPDPEPQRHGRAAVRA